VARPLIRLVVLAALVVALPALLGSQKPAPAGLPSETPAQLKPTYDGFDHERRDVMIPMRDGVKLHTVILVPKGAKRAPILLTRTPYDATALTRNAESAHLGSVLSSAAGTGVLSSYDNATDVIVGGGYIRVVQDVRGFSVSPRRRSAASRGSSAAMARWLAPTSS
jgi:hypothetical protein